MRDRFIQHCCLSLQNAIPHCLLLEKSRSQPHSPWRHNKNSIVTSYFPCGTRKSHPRGWIFWSRNRHVSSLIKIFNPLVGIPQPLWITMMDSINSWPLSHTAERCYGGNCNPVSCRMLERFSRRTKNNEQTILWISFVTLFRCRNIIICLWV